MKRFKQISPPPPIAFFLSHQSGTLYSIFLFTTTPDQKMCFFNKKRIESRLIFYQFSKFINIPFKTAKIYADWVPARVNLHLNRAKK